MRIGLIGPAFPFRGGIAHYTTLLYRALAERHDVCFISWSRQYPRLLFPGRSDRDPSRRPLVAGEVERLIDSLDPRTWRSAARRLERHDPQMVIFQWWVAFWAPHFWTISRSLQRRTTARLVFLCHNAVEHESNPLKNAATRLVLGRAHHIFTHATQETERLRRLLGDSAGVSTAFHPTYAELGGEPPPKDEARRRLRLDGPVLLFFGFVRPYKGLDVLLEALPRVLASQPVTLLVVGEFWRDKADYLATVERLGLEGHVRLVDRYVPNEEVATYFAAADLVVQPYRSASGSGICQLAYGHRRKGDCEDIEVVVPADTVERAAFLGKMKALSPKGKTPLTAAVQRAAEALRSSEEAATVILERTLAHLARRRGEAAGGADPASPSGARFWATPPYRSSFRS